MERFCKNLKQHATRIIKFEEKEMIVLTDKENKLYEKQKNFHICKKELKLKFKLYRQVRNHCHYTGKFRGAAHII